MIDLLPLHTIVLLQTETVVQEVAELFARLLEGEEVNLLRDIFAFFFTLIIVYLIARYGIVRYIMRVLRRREADPSIISLARLIGMVISAVLSFGLAFAIAGFGSFLTAMSAVGGALVIAVGLAANDLIANLIAGLYIINEKLFQVGDWIEWEDKRGRVEQIDLRITRVRTFDNELVAVPNSDLANTVITNPVAYGKLRISVDFDVGYQYVESAAEVILEEANVFPNILAEPAPSVILKDVGDTYVKLKARLWMSEPSRSDFNRLRSEYITDVVRRFVTEGIVQDPTEVHLSGDIGVDVPDSVSLE